MGVSIPVRVNLRACMHVLHVACIGVISEIYLVGESLCLEDTDIVYRCVSACVHSYKSW